MLQPTKFYVSRLFNLRGLTMTLKKYKMNLNGEVGQSVIEYALLVAISVIALVVGSNFVAGVKGRAFEAHFQKANARINNPGSAIIGTPFSREKTQAEE